MKRERKVEEVSHLNDRLEKAKALIFAGYRGLKVAEMDELRSKLRAEESGLKVVKNRLMKRVLKERQMDELDRYFDGPTAVASSEGDPVNVAKVLVEFAKAHNFLEIKGGFIEGKELSEKDVDTLAKLPSREELLARALSSMQAPASNFVGVLAALPRNLVYALSAIKDTKQ